MEEDEYKVNRLWQRIITTAKQDDKVTEEEADLITAILSFAENYHEVLDKALEDDHIDQEEKLQLIEMRNNILDKAYQEASADEEISDDEYAIIEEILRISHRLELEEEKYSTDLT